MTGDINKFSNFEFKAKGYVTYGDNNKGKIIGKGKVGAPPFTSIEDVLYVEGLKYNLLIISQLCDKVKFTKYECLIEDEANHEKSDAFCTVLGLKNPTIKAPLAQSEQGPNIKGPLGEKTHTGDMANMARHRLMVPKPWKRQKRAQISLFSSSLTIPERVQKMKTPLSPKLGDEGRPTKPEDPP
ncbi:putative copia-type protein [Trifolium pratense]|uniref:Putative copia-type protein n=1 Tax=Trifolium pratense TaxID=57577 RepID=A0A2K3MM99_TRIPR|nr:putative copia-type protein [Trifolium pratense]